VGVKGLINGEAPSKPHNKQQNNAAPLDVG